MPLNTTLLDLDRAPTILEMRTFFKKHDWSAAKISEPKSRSLEAQETISKVTMRDDYNESEFLVGGFPQEPDDLEGWTTYHEFLDEISEDTVVNIQAQAFLYGEGETVRASPEEVAYMMMREQRDPDFLSGHCDCIGESDFNVNWCPDELFGQDFVQL